MEVNANAFLISSIMNSSSPTDVRLRDKVANDMVSAQEWIARELTRIQHKQSPRHCEDHEELLQVIEDISRLLLVAPPQQPSAPAFNETALVRALVHVLRYSKRYPGHPIQLVKVLDVIVNTREADGGVIRDTLSAQQRLFATLFGKVEMTAQLADTWKIICDWAKQLAYYERDDWQAWMAVGIDAYVKAKEQYDLLVSEPTVINNQNVIDQIQGLLQQTHLAE